ncbi:putative transposase [Streptomyces sp. Tu6071]|nr:putative transposase [Streptomyces sp. Tu6071]
MDESQLALTRMPKKYRRGRQTLICTDSAGGTHDFVALVRPAGTVAVLLGRRGDHRGDPPARAEVSGIGLEGVVAATPHAVCGRTR